MIVSTVSNLFRKQNNIVNMIYRKKHFSEYVYNLTGLTNKVLFPPSATSVKL